MLGKFRNSIALNNLNFEVHIRVQWDWLTADWGPSVGTTISVVGWAINFGNVTLVKLWNSKIPAMEHLSGAEAEGFWLTSVLLSGVGDLSTILEISGPVNGSPVAGLALWSITFSGDINSNSGRVIKI